MLMFLIFVVRKVTVFMAKLLKVKVSKEVQETWKLRKEVRAVEEMVHRRAVRTGYRVGQNIR